VMGLTYFKRYRMEIDLTARTPAAPPLAPGYRLMPWHDSLLAAHAEAKYYSFRLEIDANVFPCLGDLEGCQRLMREIQQKDGFLPEATWLMAWDASGREDVRYCGTIQGICDRSGYGAIQNLGVTPEHRERGVGASLLVAALAGFRRAGLRRAYLEVTAQNDGAIRLYRRLGFRKIRTVYKTAEAVSYATQ
jgi:ribosomal protein S18 acetylase RimI-like enzyme